MLETSDLVYGSAMWSLSLVMSEFSLSGRGQGHVSNFYIVDLENFATASRRYTGDIRTSTVVGLFMTPETMGADSVEMTCRSHGWVHIVYHALPPTESPTSYHRFDSVRTCRISSFCIVAWQLARFQLTLRITRFLGDSWASCFHTKPTDWRGETSPKWPILCRVGRNPTTE